ncbi:signal transduction histidine kinase CheA [Desulfocucumis palustris]|uniref:Chemotaxis protein CheA n=1 Tax=Desulfocucumis palustris TaxID=1898651 RepID=A0A2L2XDG9_9FIRM|nr:chemotaxis protein CheA [Desulfocucumis palustris]GBF32276.1 signal transduction histidine kinase CheA [Desulfocucumis palustris]
MFSDVEMMVFMEELEEKIQLINDNVLLLEKDGESPAVIQEIFRAAHTIKGSSAVMGYEKMSRLTHEIENLFDRLRQGTMKVTTPMVDILFEALDTLKALKDEITGDAGEVDEAPVIQKIKSCLGETGGCAPAAAETPAPAGPVVSEQPDGTFKDMLQIDDILENMVREAEVRGYQAYKINIEVDPGTQMKNVRAFLVFESLQQVGDIIRSIPSAEDLQDGKYDQGFTLVLFTKEDQGEITNLLMSIAEISRVEVVPLEINGHVADGDTAVENNFGQQAAEVNETRKDSGDIKKAAAPHMEKTTIKTVRVDVQKLDSLMNLVGELVIDRTRLDRFSEIFEGKYGSDDLAENILEISNHLGQVTTDLQDEIMKARMLPVATVFNRLPRMVRDIAQKLGREIDFIVEGQETELDRNVIEIIGDPLIHLIRNAIDHGIEPPEERVALGKPRTGRVKLKASYVESHIVITLEDDGRGMDAAKLKATAVKKGIITGEAAARMSDREALELIMAPGFSTAQVVSDVSGRGVGMDIVRNQIEQINGTVELDTSVGRGTTFYIKLPLTLAIIRALMVSLGEQVYAFPLTNVQETLAIKREEIKLIRHNEVIVVRGRVLPLVRLSNIYQMEEADEERLYVVILGSAERRIGVVVHRLIGEQEIVIKSLGNYLGQITGLSGATILGDGRVALIVDARGLVKELGTEELAYAAN